MKVLYDFQTFALQSYGGISRHFYELINSSVSGNQYVSDLGIKYTSNVYLHENTKLKERFKIEYPTQNEFLPGIKFRGKGRITRMLQKTSFDSYLDGRVRSEDKLKAQDFDVFHPTYYDPYFLDFIGNKPYVLTVHDMIHELFTETLSPQEKSRIFQKRRAIENATHLIAISEKTKKDLLEIFDLDSDKVSVIYHTNTLGASPLEDTFRFPKRYFFYVGHRWAYKNFLLIAQVFAALIKDNPDFYLICAGGNKFNDDELRFFKDLGVAERIVHCGSTDEIIRSGYKNATAFIYPSLYEGFGIPILEAWDLDCPVIASNSSCFPEVGGNGALYFNPKEWKSIYTAMSRIATDSKLREDLIEKGRARSKLFTLEKMTNGIKDVYIKVMEGN